MQATAPSCSAPDTDSGTNPNTDVQDVASVDVIEAEEEEGAPSPVQATSSSPDEAISGQSTSVL